MALRQITGYSILISLLLGIFITVAAIHGIVGVLAMLGTLTFIGLVILAVHLIDS